MKLAKRLQNFNFKIHKGGRETCWRKPTMPAASPHNPGCPGRSPHSRDRWRLPGGSQAMILALFGHWMHNLAKKTTIILIFDLLVFCQRLWCIPKSDKPGSRGKVWCKIGVIPFQMAVTKCWTHDSLVPLLDGSSALTSMSHWKLFLLRWALSYPELETS